MITCPSCKNEEFSGALFCSKCGTQIILSQDDYPTNVIQGEVIEEFNELKAPTFPKPPSDASDSRVAIHILEDGNIIHIHGRNEFTFGRSTEGQTIIPDIDLSTFKAYEAGVSRLHANLNIQGIDVSIQDLGSANGTRINEDRIEPLTEYDLKHGDIVSLGRLRVQVLIQE